MTKTTENTLLEIVSPADPKSGSDSFVFLPAGSARKDGLTFEPSDEVLTETGPADIQMSELSGGAMLSFADTATAEPQPILIPADGAMLPAEVLASLLALPVNDAVLETEAGASLAGGGGSVYRDACSWSIRQPPDRAGQPANEIEGSRAAAEFRWGLAVGLEDPGGDTDHDDCQGLGQSDSPRHRHVRRPRQGDCRRLWAHIKELLARGA